MFGYVMINKGDLKVRELETYQSFYCGLCQKLKERYGLSGQLTLSYDLTFVVILLTGLYEPKVKKGTTHCVIHPLKKQPIQVDVFSDYAADMSILLNYYKCMDDWADEQKIDRRLFAELLKRKFGGLEASYSGKAEKVKELLDKSPMKPVVFEQEFFPEDVLVNENLPFTVERSEEDPEVFLVEGPKIEKMLGYTNLDSEKGFAFFQRFLKEGGILEELEKAGIQEGDTVRMYGFDFDYYK